MSAFSSSQSLISQLLQVQSVAEHHFWLTLPELCDLLGISEQQLRDPQSQSLLWTDFAWRNFRCQQVATAPDFWLILAPSSSPPSPSSAVGPTLALPPTEPRTIPIYRSLRPDRGSLPSEFVQIDQFLPTALVQELLQLTVAQEDAFVATGVATEAENYRQSRYFPGFREDVRAQRVLTAVETVMPAVMERLGIPSFPVARLESQLTAHNHGNYYKIHNDNGSPDTATRVFTYVYYFHQEPKRYQGGELRIYDTNIVNNFYVGAESFTTVEPRHNSIVFFLSRYLHEVMPVECPSRDFQASRFTVNGWIHSPTVLAV